MTRVTSALVLSSALALGLVGTPAQAQSLRTHVSAANGNDANDCSRATPCRTFQGAHDKTSADGEITVLDPGGYGGMIISKSISIVNDGVGEASMLVSGGGNAITINAGAGGYVNLRGITIQGIGFGGGNGIVVNSAFAVTITDCVIRNLYPPGHGILVQSTVSNSLSVTNTLVADNAGSGIRIVPSGSNLAVKATLSRIGSYNNHSGFLIDSGSTSGGKINVSIVDSVAANNVEGVRVVSGTNLTEAPANVMVVRSVIANNGVGLSTNRPTAEILVTQSAVTGNTTSWSATNASFVGSYGDNNINFNGDSPEPNPPLTAKR